MRLTFVPLSLCGVLMLASAPAFAQDWEAGVAAGGGFARRMPVSSARADLTRSPAFGAFLGQDVRKHLGGEIRYTLRPGDLRLSANGTEVKFRGQSHLAHYDLVVYAAPSGASLRPFLAAGGGVRVTRGTGMESAYQPLMEYALLTRTRQVQPVVSLGAGLKFKFAKRLLLRAELRDYVSPFPDQVIAPAAGARASTWLHDLVPLIGFGCTF